MNNDNLEIFVKISSQIGELNGFIKSVLEKLANHEFRLNQLENNKHSLKDSIIQTAVRGLVIAIIALGSCVGAGALIAKIISI